MPETVPNASHIIYSSLVRGAIETGVVIAIIPILLLRKLSQREVE